MFRLIWDLTRFQRRLQQLAETRQRVEPVARKAAALLFQDSTQSFVLQRDPVTGRPWVPSQRAIRQHGQTLLDTRRLSRSIMADAVESYGRWAVVGSAGVTYAKTHQFGDRRRHIRKRRFMGLTKRSLAEITKMLEDAVKNV